MKAKKAMTKTDLTEAMVDKKICEDADVQVFFDEVSKEKMLHLNVVACIFDSRTKQISKHEYHVDGKKWTVWEGITFKLTYDEDHTYHDFFNKTNGFNMRFGKRLEDDPDWCALGPEITDIEIVSGKCPKINGKNCAFCYKSNGGDVASCMTFDEFKKLLDFMPKNLTQIAFGITGVKTNPDFFKMMQYAKDNGVIPNYTTNGVDLDNEAIEKTLDLCGRIAVSCYDGAKEICYNTMRRVGEAAARRGMKFPCNIHLVISKDTHAHVMSVLNDAKEGKIPNLGAIVCLRIKPVGRACKLDCTIPESYYDEILKFGIDNKIQLGFDSCGAKMVEKVLKKLGHEELVNCVESCESTRMSVYINKDCIMTPCSFCEHLYEKQAINLKNPESQTFTEIWNNNILLKEFRTKCIACKTSCQVYELDA